jgi:hypothetical protein
MHRFGFKATAFAGAEPPYKSLVDHLIFEAFLLLVFATLKALADL